MSDDLFPAASTADITLSDQIECVRREIRMREKVYPRRIERGFMSQNKADLEMLWIRAVLETLQRIQAQPGTPTKGG